MGIKEVIEKIIAEKVVLTVLPGSVVKIETDTCTVESDHDKTDFFKVSLNAIEENGTNKLIVTPALNSKVVIGVFPNGVDAVILSCSEVDKVYFKKSTTEFEADTDGFMIKRNNENLKAVLNDYIDEVNKIIVVNGTSIDVAATIVIKARLNTILK